MTSALQPNAKPSHKHDWHYVSFTLDSQFIIKRIWYNFVFIIHFSHIKVGLVLSFSTLEYKSGISFYSYPSQEQLNANFVLIFDGTNYCWWFQNFSTRHIKFIYEIKTLYSLYIKNTFKKHSIHIWKRWSQNTYVQVITFTKSRWIQSCCETAVFASWFTILVVVGSMALSLVVWNEWYEISIKKKEKDYSTAMIPRNWNLTAKYLSISSF